MANRYNGNVSNWIGAIILTLLLSPVIIGVLALIVVIIPVALPVVLFVGLPIAVLGLLGVVAEKMGIKTKHG